MSSLISRSGDDDGSLVNDGSTTDAGASYGYERAIDGALFCWLYRIS